MKKNNLAFVAMLCMLAVSITGLYTGQASAAEYKGRVFYEVFVRSFKDSNNDGVGDLKGITQKLDYLQDLGIKGIWLMPIHSTPSYHGYDITDYYKINPQYGTMNDFEELINEAHKRDILVFMDLVINHTSVQHPWFKQALKDKNSIYRNFYCWANSKTNLNEPSPLGGDSPWVKTANGRDAYYAVFWSGMPDLNYDNPEVREEMKKIAKYYLDKGVDGFRMDGAKWIYTDEEDRTIEWWKEFNTYVKSVNKDAVLVGEVWENNPADIAPYLKGLDSCLDFPVSDQIIKGLTSSKTMKDVNLRIKEIYGKYERYNKEYVDSPFLGNHDINRVMSMLNNDREKAKQAAVILLTLPGVPYIYYGEETGMTGVKPDEALREPFIWDNKDKSQNTRWEPVKNDINKIAVSVETKDPESLLNFYKNMISLRNSNDALKYGTFDVLAVEDESVMAYKRVYDNNSVYVYINTTKEDKTESIDISRAKVLYSNRKSDTSLQFGGQIELKDGEILILQPAI